MYSKLSYEEKKKVRTNYSSTKKGRELSANLDRLLVEGVISIISCVVIVTCIFVYHLAWWYWCFAALTLLCGVIFLIGERFIRLREYNKFLVHDNKTKKNKLTKKK